MATQFLDGSHRPLIGVTAPDQGQRFMLFCTKVAVWLSGGRSMVITPSNSQEEMTLDGLIISGGTDVYPPLYKQRAKNDYCYDHSRDAMEIYWLKRMEREGKPILGICRGAQLMNIYRGGSLHRDFSKIYERAEYPSHLLARIFYRKSMITRDCSKIREILNTAMCRVNSMHTQSVDLVGRGLHITAQERNGVVQAVEDFQRPFFIGVQFHPEFLIYKSMFRHLFAEFVKQAKEKSASMQQIHNKRAMMTPKAQH